MGKVAAFVRMLLTAGGVAVGGFAVWQGSLLGDVTINLGLRGSYELNHSYGGDAYTGIQNAAAQAANNVYYGNEIVQNIAGGLEDLIGALGIALIVVGLALAVGFGIAFVDSLMSLVSGPSKPARSVQRDSRPPRAEPGTYQDSAVIAVNDYVSEDEWGGYPQAQRYAQNTDGMRSKPIGSHSLPSSR